MQESLEVEQVADEVVEPVVVVPGRDQGALRVDAFAQRKVDRAGRKHSESHDHGQQGRGAGAAHLLWTPSRLSHHLDRMERRGLVRREPDVGARGSQVVLTPHGLEAIRRAAPGHVAAVRRLFIDLLTPDTLAVLEDLNDTVMTQLHDVAPNAGGD